MQNTLVYSSDAVFFFLLGSGASRWGDGPGSSESAFMKLSCTFSSRSISGFFLVAALVFAAGLVAVFAFVAFAGALVYQAKVQHD